MVQKTNRNIYLSVVRFCAASALLGCVAAAGTGEKKQVTTTATSPAAQKKVEPGFEKGVFDKIAVHIGRLVKLDWKDENLQLDRRNWTKDFEGKTEAEAIKFLYAEMRRTNQRGSDAWMAGQAMAILRSAPPESAFIRFKAAAGHLESASTGSRGWKFCRFSTFRTKQLKGRLDYGGGGGKSFKVVLEERNPPHRTIDFRDEGGGILVIVLSDKSGKLSLTVKQDDKGRFDVKHVSGKDVFTGEENSFQAFHTRHRSYVEGRLFPLLKHVGIITPLTPHNDEVKKATIARLRSRPTPEKTSQGQKLIEQLNDNLYKNRQEASKALSADFESYRDLIARTIRNPSTPPETVSRLKIIAKSKPEQNLLDEFVTDQELVSNVDYLIGLIGEVKPADRAIVAKALQRLTKQKFGPDPIAWKKWRSKKQAGKSVTKTGKLK